MSNRYRSRAGFHHDQQRRIGVLLVNLGTPARPDVTSVRQYLREFLSDPRVVEAPRWLWWMVLHGAILRIRPSRSARAYAKVWGDDGSPLLANATAQATALASALDSESPGLYRVTLAMRYGRPALRDVLHQTLDDGVDRLVVLPLYPQYSATTTASVFDALADELKSERWLPELRFVTQYHDHPGYIDALANSVQAHWRIHGRSQRLLLSFHGIPQRYLRNGDPYHCQCHTTARLLSEKLGLAEEQWQIGFQSRVGREPWLTPYTDELLKTWGQAGLASVQVLCPGFSADCLETLEEIALENRALFQDAGGGDFQYIPALNASEDHIRLLASLVRCNTSDWLGWAKRERDAAKTTPQPRTLRARAGGASC